MLHRSHVTSLLAILAFALPAIALGGTLEQIKKSGEIRIGYPTDAPPLAFNDASGQAAGYSVDLCKRVAMRDDSAFRLVVNRALAQVYRTGQIEQIYNRWFSQVGIRASNVLTAMYLLQALPE